MKRNSKGFTIVELIIVIAVIAILAAVLVPVFGNLIEKAQINNDIVLTKNLNTQLAIYEAENGQVTQDYQKEDVLRNAGVSQLEPSSAKYGYHIWLDFANHTFVLSKSNEDPISTVKGGEAASAVYNAVGAFLGRFAIKAYADKETEEPPVAGANLLTDNVFRTSIKPGYYLVDKKGSDVAEAVTILNNPQDGDDYKHAIELVYGLSNDKHDSAVYETLKKVVDNTIIFSDNGIFEPENPTDVAAAKVYFVDGITSISKEHFTFTVEETTVSIDTSTEKIKTKAKEIVLPETITGKIDSLIFEEKMTVVLPEGKKVEDLFTAGSTNALIKVGEDLVQLTLNDVGCVFDNIDTYLYRIGNANTVTLGQLFELDDPVKSDEVSIKVEAIEDNSTVKGTVENSNLAEGSTAKCVYKKDADDWTSSTLKFSGEGPVKVTIEAEGYNPFTLNLEIVNGENVTEAKSATSKNIILLNDVSTSSLTVSGGYALYGNGFKVTDTRTSPTAVNNQNGYVTINNGTVDNVQFIGYEPKAQNFTNSGNTDVACAVKISSGGANIYNCYISGGRYAVDAASSTIVMINTTIDGGAVGNMLIGGGNVTLENCVTTHSTRGGLKGFGICVPSAAGLKLNIKGTFTQYNWIKQSDVLQKASGGAGIAAKAIVGEVYNESDFAVSHGDNKYVNMGIFFLDVNSNITAKDAAIAINDITGNSYGFIEKTASGTTACCYTAKATMFEAMLADPEFKPNNYATVPAVSFDHTVNYKAYSATESYCIEEGGVENIQVVKRATGDAFEWNPYIMTISDKYGNALSYTVKLNGTEYAQGSKIKFDTAGDYNVEYIYTDPYNFDKNLEKSGKEYTQIQKVHVTTLADYHPQFSYVGDWTANAKQVVANDTVYIMPDVSGTSEKFGKTTVGGQTIYYPIVEVSKSGGPSGNIYFKAPAFTAINIKDFNKDTGVEKYSYNSKSQKWPHGLSGNTSYTNFTTGTGDTTKYYGYVLDTNLTTPWHYMGVSANGNQSNAKVAYDNTYGLIFCDGGLSAPRYEKSQLVQFWYRGDDGTVYYYYIQYHFPESKYTITINCTGGTVDNNKVYVSYKGSLSASGNQLKDNNGKVLATITPNDGYKVQWPTLPTSVSSNMTLNVACTKECTLTINCGEGGSVDKQTVSIASGSKLTFKGNSLLNGTETIATAKPNSGLIGKWELPDTAIENDTEIDLTFVTPVTITITAGDGGSVSPTSVKVAPGKKLSTNSNELLYDGVKIATATANKNYNVGSWSGVTSNAITADTSVSVSFSSCILPGTLITLADGTQKPVEEIAAGDMLLTWDLMTGSYSAKPVVFNDSEEAKECEVIYVTFSDGTRIGIVSEHGFFDIDLGKYVYLDKNAAEYIGHAFIKQDGSTVTLTDVEIERELIECYSPTTFGDLCYYTNGMLSMPGGISGLFNIFDVDTDTMKYDEAQMQADIETYGLLDIEAFGGMITEEMFEAFNGKYLGIAVGKGNLTWEYIAYLAERYAPLCD